jgi:hypothetical protein
MKECECKKERRYRGSAQFRVACSLKVWTRSRSFLLDGSSECYTRDFQCQGIFFLGQAQLARITTPVPAQRTLALKRVAHSPVRSATRPVLTQW